MVPLLQLKEQAVENLSNYSKALENRLKNVELGIKQLEELLEPGDSLKPFKLFKLARHLYFDWKKWFRFLKEQIGSKEILKAQRLRPRMPSVTDYKEALYAIYRLQTTYDLDPAEMSEGLLRGKQYRCKKWSALECLMVGTTYYLDENFENAEIWFKLAQKKYYQHSIPKQFAVLGIPYKFILILLMKSARSSGRYKTALNYAKKGFNLELNTKYWEDQMAQIEALIKNPEVIKPFEPFKYLFKPACRKKYPHVHLKCQYLKASPFLKLAPIKMEKVFLDPPMSIYHDLINEKEISLLKNLSTPYLKRSELYSEYHGVFEDFSNLRTCKTMRLDDTNHPLLEKLNNRIVDATGLSVKDSEKLQISNYGIGGHLYEHQDFTTTTKIDFWNSGNRVITALFYLSDVEQGGDTVFPHLNLKVPAQKGSLMVWYNLLSNGTTDSRVLHASCPVLMGNKWIATKWLREKAQTFIRKCPKDFQNK
ncbi:uncharacterized protein Dana_GF10815 [Drosophila ananassae]|uniref:procollagen-proline 4-dioxygenase n=2 Tax=Drosophila ananassae TaxID=7217 RepID=B3M895_DROAN|nr:uncharacterized protein Dana_GF10815 [Drosophila ananassae]